MQPSQSLDPDMGRNMAHQLSSPAEGLITVQANPSCLIVGQVPCFLTEAEVSRPEFCFLTLPCVLS
jgi:hypothetical protein